MATWGSYLVYGAEKIEKLENFTNSSAMMIAYERALETRRGAGVALFRDPFAAALAGDQGEELSNKFGDNCTMFGMEGWPEFHKTWTVVRTKFIDDHIKRCAAKGQVKQLVNLGAGMDTRAYRLECYKTFSGGVFEVDMDAVNKCKRQIFQQFLHARAFCGHVHYISLDFLSSEKTLKTELSAGIGFDKSKPAVFVSEGLVMYLGEIGKVKLLKDLSAVAAPGSVLILNFMEDVKSNSPAALSKKLATDVLTQHGWGKFVFSQYGDESLNFGRFPTDKFKPQPSFSFVVCVKQ